MRFYLVNWNGEEIKKRVSEACRLGIDETTASCVKPAKDRVHVDTRLLQGSIQFRPATYVEGRGWVGRWGSFNVNYAWWQEVLPEPRGRMYLRPAAQAEYPKLRARINAYLKGKVPKVRKVPGRDPKTGRFTKAK